MNGEQKLFYRKIIALAIPIALQNIMGVAMQFTDVLVLGRVGEKALAAASLAGQVNFVLTLFLFGLGSGSSVLSAQYWGKKDHRAIEAVMGICLRFALLAGLAFMLSALVFPEFLMRLLSSDLEVRALGTQFLRVVCPSYLFMAFSTVYLIILRSMERVRVAAIISGICLVINMAGNVALVFGLGPFPALGVRGSALATSVASLCQLLLVLGYNRWRKHVVHFRFRMLLVRNKLLFGDFLKISGPVVLNEFLWGLGMAIVAAVIGQLGSEASAANAVVQTVRSLAMVGSMGVASSSAVLVGKAIGAGKQEEAKIYARRYVRLILITGLFGAAVVLLIRPLALMGVSLSPLAKEYLSLMMYLTAPYVFLQAYNCLMIVGLFRSGGDTRISLFLDLLSVWGISVFCGFLAAFVFKLPAPAVFVIILLDEYGKLPLVIWRYRSYKWLRDVTRDDHE